MIFRETPPLQLGGSLLTAGDSPVIRFILSSPHFDFSTKYWDEGWDTGNNYIGDYHIAAGSGLQSLSSGGSVQACGLRGQDSGQAGADLHLPMSSDRRKLEKVR